MSLKIKRPDDKKIKEQCKYWTTVYILGLFFLALAFTAAFLSDVYVGIIILLACLPLIFLVLSAQQEQNYNKILLEIREKYKEE